MLEKEFIFLFFTENCKNFIFGNLLMLTANATETFVIRKYPQPSTIKNHQNFYVFSEFKSEHCEYFLFCQVYWSLKLTFFLIAQYMLHIMRLCALVRCSNDKITAVIRRIRAY